ncbi:MAG TPA: hypothetical protein DD390_12105, partial [Rhodospirillaceae bacterium]|nr:hypothetical protein [Rhodospirillaceae bacterium]
MLAGCDDTGEDAAEGAPEEETRFQSQEDELSITRMPDVAPLPAPEPPPAPPVVSLPSTPLAPGRAEVAISRLDFGQQTLAEFSPGQSVQRQFQILYGGGDEPITVFSVNTDRTDLFLIQPCATAVLARASNPTCTVTVTFQPPPGEYGEFRGNILITLIEGDEPRTVSVPAVARVFQATVAAPPPPPP